MPRKVTDEILSFSLAQSMRILDARRLAMFHLKRSLNTCLQNEPDDDIVCFLRDLKDADGAVQPCGGHDVPVDLQVPDGVGVQRDVVQQIPIVATKDLCGAVVAACSRFGRALV